MNSRLRLKQIYLWWLASKWRSRTVEGVPVPLKLRIRRYLTAEGVSTEERLMAEFMKAGEQRATIADALRQMQRRNEIRTVQQEGAIYIYPTRRVPLLGRRDIARLLLLGLTLVPLTLSLESQNGVFFLASASVVIATMALISEV
jgi:uncharacterized protein YoaH (UPF0181 family)